MSPHTERQVQQEYLNKWLVPELCAITGLVIDGSYVEIITRSANRIFARVAAPFGYNSIPNFKENAAITGSYLALVVFDKGIIERPIIIGFVPRDDATEVRDALKGGNVVSMTTAHSKVEMDEELGTTVVQNQHTGTSLQMHLDYMTLGYDDDSMRLWMNGSYATFGHANDVGIGEKGSATIGEEEVRIGFDRDSYCSVSVTTDEIILGGGLTAPEPLVKGDTLEDVITKLIEIMTTGLLAAGQMPVALNPAFATQFAELQTKLATMKSNFVKTV